MIETECRGQKSLNHSSKHNVRFCWTCNHFSKIISEKCDCRKQRVAQKKPNGEKYQKTLLNFDQILAGKREPEYRFYSVEGVFWVKESTIKRFEALKCLQKHEKYYKFIKHALESGEISFVSRMIFDGPK